MNISQLRNIEQTSFFWTFLCTETLELCIRESKLGSLGSDKQQQLRQRKGRGGVNSNGDGNGDFQIVDFIHSILLDEMPFLSELQIFLEFMEFQPENILRILFLDPSFQPICDFE